MWCPKCGETVLNHDAEAELWWCDDCSEWFDNNDVYGIHRSQLTMRAPDVCPRCAGACVFYYDGDTPAPCPSCEGTGKRR